MTSFNSEKYPQVNDSFPCADLVSPIIEPSISGDKDTSKTILLESLWNNFLPAAIGGGCLLVGRRLRSSTVSRIGQIMHPKLTGALKKMTSKQEYAVSILHPKNAAKDAFFQILYQDTIHTSEIQKRIALINSLSNVNNLQGVWVPPHLNRVEAQEWILETSIGNLKKRVPDPGKLLELSKNVKLPSKWELHLKRSGIDKSLISQMKQNQKVLETNLNGKLKTLSKTIESKSKELEVHLGLYEKNFLRANYLIATLIATGLSLYLNRNEATWEDVNRHEKELSAFLHQKTEESFPASSRLMENTSISSKTSEQDVVTSTPQISLDPSHESKIKALQHLIEISLSETLKDCSETERQEFKRDSEMLLNEVVEHIYKIYGDELEKIQKLVNTINEISLSHSEHEIESPIQNLLSQIFIVSLDLFLASNIVNRPHFKKLIGVFASRWLSESYLQNVVAGMTTIGFKAAFKSETVDLDRLLKKPNTAKLLTIANSQKYYEKVSQDKLSIDEAEFITTILATALFSSFSQGALTGSVKFISQAISLIWMNKMIHQPFRKDDLKAFYTYNTERFSLEVDAHRALYESSMQIVDWSLMRTEEIIRENAMVVADNNLASQTEPEPLVEEEVSEAPNILESITTMVKDSFVRECVNIVKNTAIYSFNYLIFRR